MKNNYYTKIIIKYNKMTEILADWKNSIVQEEFKLLIDFITNKQNIPELDQFMLVLIGSQVQTIKLLLDIQEVIGPDDSDIEPLNVLKNDKVLYQLYNKKLVMFETNEKPLQSGCISGRIKSIIGKESRVFIDGNPDNHDEVLLNFDIVITANSKDKFVNDAGLLRRSKFIHVN